MQHIIIGTAGHVDHGKTSLVKAITGVDCDSHPEEKRRGITINNGYAYLNVGENQYLAFVDVPGHKRFVNTMVAGAAGVDFALLIIAADDGVMPQTIEHLQIIELLGIRAGAVVITKIDCVNDEQIEFCRFEIKELIGSTIFDQHPIFQVSARLGVGIAQLRNYLASLSLPTQVSPPRDVFRLYIDRIFSQKGMGTVVTGTVISGTMSQGKTVFLHPVEKSSRVRRLQRHKIDVEQVQQGDRAALNLPNFEPTDIKPGMMLAERLLPSTRLIDASIRLIDTSHPLSSRTTVQFLSGTFKTQARLHMLDRDKLRARDTALVQISLTHRFPLVYGDAFILRANSGDYTLGGGYIFDPFPFVHRRKKQALIERLTWLASGTVLDYIYYKVKEHPDAIPLDFFTTALHQSMERIQVNVASLETVTLLGNKHPFLVETRKNDWYQKHVENILMRLSEKYPFQIEGFTVHEILLELKRKKNLSLPLITLENLLENFESIRYNNGYWKLAVLPDQLAEESIRHIDFVEQYFLSCKQRHPLLSELQEEVKVVGILPEKLISILAHLCRQGRLIAVEEIYLHNLVVEWGKEVLLQNLKNHPAEGITVAQFRDLLNTNRKVALLIFAVLERFQLIERRGEKRYITGKGKEYSLGFI